MQEKFHFQKVQHLIKFELAVTIARRGAGFPGCVWRIAAPIAVVSRLEYRLKEL